MILFYIFNIFFFKLIISNHIFNVFNHLDNNKLNFNNEIVNNCPFILNPKICLFNISDKFSILYNIKYGLKYLYLEKNIINCDIYKPKFEEIKHFILIRFYCLEMMPKNKLFDENLLNKGIDIFTKFTLKSLENQSNKNFEIIIIIHNEINSNHPSIKKLLKLKTILKLKILKLKELQSYINNNSKNINYLITTRIDHDDLIYKDAVEEIQNKCNKNIPLYYNGYNKLITMIGNDIKNCYKFYPNYKGLGSISIFQSLIVNKIKINKLYNIYDLGNHANQKMKFIDIYKKNNLEYKEIFFNINHIEDCCIYIKHKFNHSTWQKKKLDKNWHRTKKKIKKKKKWFVERFGNFI